MPSSLTSLPSLSRRRLLQLTGAGLAAGAVAGAAACSPGATPPEDSPSGGTLTLPSYRAIDTIKPDLAGDDPEIPVAFLNYPAEPVRLMSNGAPLTGGTVTAIVEASGAVPPPAASNPYWQELNRRLGTDLQMSVILASEYIAKFQATVAGDQLPDLAQIKPLTPKLSGLLDAKFLDLTDVLGGDQVLKYPNIAAIPTYAWKACVLDGKLRGVPFSQPLISSGLAARIDIVTKAGLDLDLRDGDDLLDLCRQLTSAKDQRWALQKPDRVMQYVIAPMMGTPNTWRVDGDTFVSYYETDEFAAALAMTAQMWSEGLFHPESVSSPKGTWLTNGNTVMDQNGLTAWSLGKSQSPDPDFDLRLVRLPKWDGGGSASVHQLNGIYTYAALKKTDDAARVDELLKVVNWLAAPFGSEEQLFRSYGIEGRHYTLNGSNPVPTEAASETRLPTSYLGRGAPFIYTPGLADQVKDQFDYHKEFKPTSLPLPTVGLTSETDTNKRAVIGRDIGDTMIRIITGQSTMKEWPEAVSRWKAAGGDVIAQEYAESKQANG